MVSQTSLVGCTDTEGNETFKESPCSTGYQPAVCLNVIEIVQAFIYMPTSILDEIFRPAKT